MEGWHQVVPAVVVAPTCPKPKKKNPPQRRLLLGYGLIARKESWAQMLEHIRHARGCGHRLALRNKHVCSCCS